MMAEYNANNAEYLKKMLDDHGVKLRNFNDDIYDAFAEASEEVFEETQEHSNLASRIHNSFLKARSEIGDWNNISDVAYLEQRNRVLKERIDKARPRPRGSGV